MSTNRVQFDIQESGPTPPAPETPSDPNRPAWLPENFKTPEDFAKSYNEQRAEITRLQQAAKGANSGQEGNEPPADPETPPVDPQKKDGEQPTEKSQDDAAEKVAKAAGVDLTTYQQEYAEKGDVSPESRKALAESLKGVLGENAAPIVDEFIEARKIVHANDKQLYMDEVGGSEAYAVMTEWAKTNMKPAEIEAYNKQVQSGDRSATLLALSGLKAKFEAANGKAPRLVKGASGVNPGQVLAYKSSAEMRRDMSDPRYKTDQAFRDEVKARLAISDI